MSYPQFLVKNRAFAWLSPPPLGRVLFLACYWAIIAFMMTHASIINDAYYYERIGFRNAWISVTQVPLVYLLASKSSIIGFTIGSSHERLNWFHRWVSRTLLITVTVHGGFFLREWVRADFVMLELQMMPMVKYGMGAWSILVWTFITSLSPLRSMAYEVFVLQHIAAAPVFLWLLWVHVPSYASYNVWFAIGAISFDWVLRFCLAIYQNVRVPWGHTCNGTRWIGHQVNVMTNGSDITVVTIKDVHLSWKPGQHIYLWIPAIGPLESHPLTIAVPYKTPKECHCNEIQVAIKAQSGFSRRINRYATKAQGVSKSSLTGFILGPYGSPFQWETYETLLLISASTGASFTLPILESILHSRKTICTRRIKFLLIVRQRNHIEYYVDRLLQALAHAQEVCIILDIEIAITDDEGSLGDDGSVMRVEEEHDGKLSNGEIAVSNKVDAEKPYVITTSHSHSTSSSVDHKNSTENDCRCGGESTNLTGAPGAIIYSYGRPNIDAFIRYPVEETGGETSVAVCGGKSLVATVRNAVASLSNDRAIHKGTGAQGIHLHVEEYCF